MNVWLVTTGSSDVQLTSKDKWDDWWQEIKKPLYRLRFEPVRAIDDDEEPYRLPARVLGIAHDRLTEQVQPYLLFPLLQNFAHKLKAKKIKIDQIIILISDQENLFPESERETKRCPYWQDTCQLYPLLEGYLGNQFPDAIVKPLILKPQPSGSGLDDWDAILDLVKQKVGDLTFETKPKTVYVSHQAGTPAISSAVQFSSLAKFGDRVKFLVSNEYNPTLPEKPLEGSSYLRGIRIQEAKTLLNRCDYFGLMILLKPYLDAQKPQEKRIRSLLKAAIQWNLAKFANFRRLLVALNILDEEKISWYWMGYESAYLAVVRYKQGNIIESLFHSFRAVEGMICEWAITKHFPYVYYDKKGSPQISERIQEVLPNYWKKVADKNQKWLSNLAEQNQNREAKGKLPEPIGVGLFSQNLYLLLEEVKPKVKKDPFLKKGLYSAKDTRNQQFHRLLGLREKDLINAWGVDSIAEWEETVVGCLNAIAKDDLPEAMKFKVPKDASLMVKVHQELESAIAAL